MDFLNGTPEDKLEDFLIFNSTDPVDPDTDIYSKVDKLQLNEPTELFNTYNPPEVSDLDDDPKDAIKLPDVSAVPVAKEDTKLKEIDYSKLTATKQKVVEGINKLAIDSNSKRYLLKLANRESHFNPAAVNQYGYAGLYQFQKAALDTVHVSKNQYMSDITTQHTAALRLADVNFKILKPYHNLIGTTIKGIKITKHGLMAASHLIGAGNVIKFLRTKGEFDKKDGNGTKCSSYLKYFSDIT